MAHLNHYLRSFTKKIRNAKVLVLEVLIYLVLNGSQVLLFLKRDPTQGQEPLVGLMNETDV